MSNNSVPKSPIVWPGSGTSTQLASAAGTPITVSPSSSLTGGTLSVGGWQTAYSIDFTTQASIPGPWGTANSTTTQTIAGVTWSVINGGIQLGVSLTNGTGLQFAPGNNSGNCWLLAPLFSLITTVPRQFRLISRMKYASGSESQASASIGQMFVQYDGIPIVTANRVAIGFGQNSSGRVSTSTPFGLSANNTRSNGITQPSGTADNMFMIEQWGPRYYLSQGPSASWTGNLTVDVAKVFDQSSGSDAVWNNFTDLSTAYVGWYMSRPSSNAALTITVTNLAVQVLG